ncbi:hypothetical protein JX266_013595 [Neoarthrinium moseri]|nr:hypothetical protein JX266_013595 [Neoarthrinium moseri]
MHVAESTTVTLDRQSQGFMDPEETKFTRRTEHRPRGRPPRAPNWQDAQAIHSLWMKIQFLDDTVQRVSQAMQGTLQIASAAACQGLDITMTRRPVFLSPTDRDLAIDDASSELECLAERPVVPIDLSLYTTTAHIQRALIERFIDCYGTSLGTEAGSEYWIHDGRPWCLWRFGSEICAFSPLLQAAYLSVSTAYSGLSLNDKYLIRAGAHAYPSVLAQLQKALNDLERSKSDAVLVTTWGAILARKPSFLASQPWKTIPWSTGSTEKDFAQHLFDEMLEIPTLLWYYDQFRTNNNHHERNGLQKKVIKLAIEIDSRLRQWKEDWIDRISERRSWEVTVTHPDHDFPVFMYMDPNDHASFIEPPSLFYPNCAIFSAVCNHYSALLVVLEVIRLLEGQPRTQTQIIVAREICRSCVYLTLRLPYSMMGRVATAMAAAYDILPPGGIERRYLEKLYTYCAGGTWRIFEDFIQEFSVFRGGWR